MLKVKTSNTSRLKSYISKHGKNIFSLDGNILFCKILFIIMYLSFTIL